MRIGINGLGRIGRTVLRTLWQRREHEVVLVNDLNPDVANLAYLIRYDSNYGRFPARVEAGSDCLTISDGQRNWTIGCRAVADTRQVGWADSGADVVLEATGTDRNNRGCRDYLGADAVRHAVVTHTNPHADVTVVFGVNQDTLDVDAHKVISASICDANALSPVVKAIHGAFGIEHAFVTTLHPWLSYQNLVDGPVRFRAQPGAFYPDYALGRASPGTLIPKTTTAGSAIESLIPELSGRISSSSYRVPTTAVCYGDVSATLANNANLTDLFEVLKELDPYVRLSNEPLVSTDMIGEAVSGVVDTRWMSIAHGKFFKGMVAYDNEWGYCSRLCDLVDKIEAQHTAKAEQNAIA